MNGIVDASEMISRVFSNIEASDMDNANKLTSIWKKVVRGIKNNRDEMYGEKIASHSDLVDFKNGQLLIETDHSGWIQAMQMYSKFIIRGMNMSIGENGPKVEGLVFRLKGNTTTLFDTYESQMKKYQEKMEMQAAADEKAMDVYSAKSGACGANSDSTTGKKQENLKKELPADFLAKLASLESSVLTNSKNK
ncbi:MAG: DUF721 domain-containing protein [Treponema sp.]|nr:DUF721 domain-containing protein [Treponema sp.]